MTLKVCMKHESVEARDNATFKVNLPQLHSPFFNGKIQYWPEFWIFSNPQCMSKTYQLCLSSHI